jgi:hypothetical protein
LFPSVSSVKRPISGNTLNATLRRLGYGPNEMTAHGFRAMAATRLNAMGRWNPELFEILTTAQFHEKPNSWTRHMHASANAGLL